MNGAMTITKAEYQRMRAIADAAAWCVGCISVAKDGRRAAYLKTALATVETKLTAALDFAETEVAV